MKTFAVYIVDDEPTIREGITLAFESSYQMEAFADAENAIQALKHDPPDLILLDIGLPGIDGIQALRQIKALQPDTPVIMITAYEDIQSVIAAMKLGAYDYVVKPIHMDSLEVTIQNALEAVRLRKEVQALQEKYLRENIPCFVGESDAIQDIMHLIEKVAKSPDTPILILGETGTGKELIASAIHYRSPNFKGPFMTVNCAAIPDELIESELFGYEKGAFSGAGSSGKHGLIEAAANGTLFLDEIGDLSLEAQSKLLRFLELGEFYRVGGTTKKQIQTRVVSATNKDLDAMIVADQFRKDLYFRIGVIKIEIPSLNARRDDILPLARYFLFEFNRKLEKNFTGLSALAENALRDHVWAGNVRELKNMVERGVLLGNGPELTRQDLGIDEVNGTATRERNKDAFEFPLIPPTGIDLTGRMEAFEKQYLKQALDMAKGNESKAAKLLNINHHTFRYRRRKLKIE